MAVCADQDLRIREANCDQEFIEATPTAESLPLFAGVQDDEVDSEIGMTYKELSVFGLRRKFDLLGS
jgi:NAD+ synthase (glutamine-hydrolysing)